MHVRRECPSLDRVHHQAGDHRVRALEAGAAGLEVPTQTKGDKYVTKNGQSVGETGEDEDDPLSKRKYARVDEHPDSNAYERVNGSRDVSDSNTGWRVFERTNTRTYSILISGRKIYRRTESLPHAQTEIIV